MKYFVITDVHGYYDQMKKALDEAGFNPETDTLISCGDLIDRGPKSLEVIKFVMSCPHRILLQGNHEDLLESYFRGRETTNADFTNGTVDSYWTFYYNSQDLWKQYQHETENAVEIGKYIFTHGFLPTITVGKMYNLLIKDWRENPSGALWCAARWKNGIELGEFQNLGEDNKITVVGHWTCSYGNAKKLYPQYKVDEVAYSDKFKKQLFAEPFFGKKVIGLDMCTAWTKKIYVFTFETNDEPIVYKRDKTIVE